MLENAVEQGIKFGRRVGIIGARGGDGLKLSELRALWRLSQGDRKKLPPKLRPYKSFKEYLNHCEDMGDAAGCNMCGLVRDFGAELPDKLKRLEAALVDHWQAESVQVVLSTVHKAKGLEFARVRIANDFSSKVMEGRVAGLPDWAVREELNMLYVAVTRAKQELQVSRDLALLLDEFSGNGGVVLHSPRTTLGGFSDPPLCQRCELPVLVPTKEPPKEASAAAAPAPSAGADLTGVNAPLFKWSSSYEHGCGGMRLLCLPCAGHVSPLLVQAITHQLENES